MFRKAQQIAVVASYKMYVKDFSVPGILFTKNYNLTQKAVITKTFKIMIIPKKSNELGVECRNDVFREINK